MHKMKWLLAAFLVICSSFAFAQAKSDDHPTVPKVLDFLVSDVEGEFVLAAEAMPEDKYAYAPTNGEFKGVRTFAQQVKHVAAMNYIIGASIIGENPTVDVGSGNGPDAMTSKADKAVGRVNEKSMLEPIKNPFGEGTTTRLGMSGILVGHCFDHYGQMVEYLRSNGIMPPKP